MTAATKRLTPGEWEMQAITLAEEAHLVHRARFLGTGVYGNSLWQVPSTMTDGTVYVVQVWPTMLGAVCSCFAKSLGHRACAHAGAALVGEHQKQAAERGSGGDEGDTALRWFAHGGEWWA
jgi:hypothetical protein